MSIKEVREEHPSFGAITVGRVSSGGAHALYGSSIKHRDTIRIEIRHSRRTRSLSKDWFTPSGLICEVEMSQTQWAEFVSSINMGDGVPCTIRWNGGPVEDCPYSSKQEQFEQEFQDDVQKSMESLDAAIAAATDLLQKKSLTKADRENLLRLLKNASNALSDGIPFIQKQFHEQMDRTVTEVKGELEAWQADRMQKIALRAISQTEGDKLTALTTENAPLPIELPDES